jgi:dienelactone hydrolase
MIKAQERRHARRDTNRLVRPFEWGASYLSEHTNGDDPRLIFERHTREALQRSEDFYALPPVSDYRLDGETLVWTSAVHTPSIENNTARARFFRAPLKKTRRDAEDGPRRAVVVLPQWNADAESHVELCRILNRLGISALRLTLPYHEARRPAELERADYLVCSNIGRTIQSVRQAVLDTRAAVSFLVHEGYERIGIIGTSIGSCTAFLAFAHDPRICAGVFNHVSGYFADVVWHGISTQHVRAGIEPHLTLEELRAHWLPISPAPFAPKLLENPGRPVRFIAARYDLTFPADLSREVIAEVRRLDIPLDVAWLPCGHYTSGARPWVYLDGWKIVTFLRRNL